MTNIRTLVALSVAALAAACASPGSVNAPSVSSLPAADHDAPADQGDAAAPMAAMDPRMKAMHQMHRKMMDAKTPEERQAMMADHMKAMQDGMAMMKEMDGKGAMGGKAPMAGMGATGATAGAKKGMPDDMAKHHQTMAQRMDTMQMMMEMMMDRMPPSPARK